SKPNRSSSSFWSPPFGASLRTRNNSPLCWSGWRAAWQAHGEHRAFALLARHGHVTAHHARELAGDGEAETAAVEAPRGRGIGLAELLEQLLPAAPPSCQCRYRPPLARSHCLHWLPCAPAA